MHTGTALCKFAVETREYLQLLNKPFYANLVVQIFCFPYSSAGLMNDDFLAELLRVIRRLNMKEQWTDLSLHFVTLRTLRSTLYQNVRAQNHFRSIGGLEVLLDGLGLPTSRFSFSKSQINSGDDRYRFFTFFLVPVHFHLLSLTYSYGSVP